MRHTTYQNPTWVRPWDEENLKAFLREAREYLGWKTQRREIKQNHGLAWDSPYRILAKEPPGETTVLQWLYKLGRDTRVLPMCFDHFCHEVKQDPRPYYRPFNRKKWRRRYAPRANKKGYELCGPNKEPYRQRNQHAHVEKKVRDQKFENKQAWREEKQFNRDASRYEGWRRGGCSAKTWAKRWSNRAERRHVRQALQQDQPITPHRLFNDPWMWD